MVKLLVILMLFTSEGPAEVERNEVGEFNNMADCVAAGSKPEFAEKWINQYRAMIPAGVPFVVRIGCKEATTA